MFNKKPDFTGEYLITKYVLMANISGYDLGFIIFDFAWKYALIR